MPKKKRYRKGLIKKGAPHPTRRSFKFDSAHLTDREADKREDVLLDQPGVKAISRVGVPKQELVYVKRGKSPRITPKTPRLRR